MNAESPFPHRLSVVGFDDIRLAQFTAPPLTTVRISQADLAIRAFQMLTHRDKTLSSSVEYVLKPRLKALYSPTASK
jgi:DNA-binding LacI/PurR family transcriptional regulator